MAWLRKSWPVLWRLATLSLPWQTRWFVEGVRVGGYAWEQGRISIYASWVLVLATIVWSGFMGPSPSITTVVARLRTRRGLLGIVGVSLILLSVFLSQSLRASGQWLIEMTLLVFFFAALARQRVTFLSFMQWLTIGLVPQIILAAQQWVTQTVIGSTILGIAPQHPITPGVSVIESFGHRILRVYGGFPHPNIFGGWLACVLPWMWIFLFRAKTFRAVVAYACLGMLFSVVLLLTFSRSAWIACVVGWLFVLYYFLVHERRHRPVSTATERDPANPRDRRRRLAAWLGVLAIVAVMVGTMGVERNVLTERVTSSSRLEVRSVDERTRALQMGWRLFLRHPWFGVGPDATILALDHEGFWTAEDRTTGPPVPPHVLPIIILDELGLLGVIGGCLLLAALWFIRYRHERPRMLCWLPVVIILALGCFDHDLWSVWSGRVLFILAVVGPIILPLDDQAIFD